MRYRVRHTTEYKYNAPVTLCYNMAHLLPRDTDNQRCTSHRINVSPTPIYQREGVDYYGNSTFYFSIQEPHSRLMIDVVSFFDIENTGYSELVNTHLLTCGQVRTMLAEAATPELRMVKEFVLDSAQIKLSESLADYAREVFSDDKPILKASLEFTQKIFNEFKFDPTATNVTTPPEQVLKEKRGVCQDFAHLAIGCIRSVGLPVRYMSGYIETIPPEGQVKLVGADASHAWFSVYVPDLGWVEFDPTNNIMPSDQHIVTAWGRDYADVTPLQGVIFDGGDSQVLSVSVDVARI
ncbi:transglutaminase family protein [Vibrio sp. WJH972]